MEVKMSLSLTKRTLAALALLLASPALGAEVAIGEFGYGGPGCPQGTISIEYPKEWAHFWFSDIYAVVHYDSFATESAAKATERKACNLALPVQVPSGWSVAPLIGDQLVTLALPSDSTLLLSTETFFAGSKAAKVKETWTGPLDEIVFVKGAADADAKWSACGSDINLRSSVSIELTSTTNSVAKGQLQSTRIHKLQTKRC